jgi:hypothetical protein
MTGRGLGPCGAGLRRGRGRGFGRGFRCPVAQPVSLTREEQMKILEAEKAEIEAELKQLSEEIKSLKDSK